MSPVTTNLLAEVFTMAADTVAAGWTQGVSARAGVEAVAFDSQGATCWCAAGAIGRSSMALGILGWRQLYSDALTHANKIVRRADPRVHLMVWNDALGRTQDEVVALLRECARTVSP